MDAGRLKNLRPEYISGSGTKQAVHPTVFKQRLNIHDTAASFTVLNMSMLQVEKVKT